MKRLHTSARRGKSVLYAGAGALAVAMGSFAAPAYAQDAADAAEEEVVEQAIVVTGSRISNPNAQLSSPVGVISSEEFSIQQVLSVEDVLRDIPGSAPGIGAQVGNGGNGAATINLRGLGDNRNLVLIDGNRVVPATLAAVVDTNIIPISLLQRVDVFTGGASTAYGADAVVGVVNFVTRAIPDEPTVKGGFQTETSPSSSHDGFKTSANLLAGGTNENGLGGALLYSGTRGGDWREHSDSEIDDLILKGKYQLDEANSFNAMAQYYEGKADMPGGLNVADYDADPYQSTRPKDQFWGRRTMFNFGYRYQEDRREFTANTFFTKTLRSGYLDQGTFLSLSPREYWVRGLETRFAQGFDLAQ